MVRRSSKQRRSKKDVGLEASESESKPEASPFPPEPDQRRRIVSDEFSIRVSKDAEENPK